MSEGGQRKMDRPETIRSTRNSKDKQMLSSCRLNLFHITLHQQRNTYTRFVVGTIPKFFSVLFYLFLCQPIRDKFMLFFLYT